MAEEMGTEEWCSVVYKIKRAHKLVPIVERDWGLQAFRLPGEQKKDGVYVHTRGAFGGGVSGLLLPEVGGHGYSGGPPVDIGGHDLGLLHLLFADDGWLLGVGKHCWRPLLFWLFVLEPASFR